jgi:hypothetical protein
MLGHGSVSTLEIVNVQLLAVAPLASVTLIVNVPAAVGVPVMAPVELFRIRPDKLPVATENVKGLVPPVTVRGPEVKARPTSAEVVVGQEMTGAFVIVTVRVAPAVETN